MYRRCVTTMQNSLKITSTLADETRFSIYQYMLQEKENFTVQNIADKFNIHPNVARLHLTKLSEINVISAEYEKTGKGGRPGRIYRAVENGISLSFPKRNYEELLDWVLEILDELGPEALEVGTRICYQKGQTEIRHMLQEQKTEASLLTFDEKVDCITKAASLIGYIPLVKQEEGQEERSIRFAVYNCPYHNEIDQHSEIVCALHESFLKGQFDYLFEVDEFVKLENMIDGCKYCSYRIQTNG